MAASNSTRPVTGATGFKSETGKPAVIYLDDSAGKQWAYWFDSSGTLRFADAATVEAAGFNFSTGGIVATPVVAQISGVAAAAAVDQSFFIASRAYKVIDVRAVFGTASTSGTLQIKKCTGTTAPGSGTDILTGTISLAGTANTALSGTLTATAADLLLAAGDRLALDFGGTVTNLVGLVVQITLVPVG